MHYSIKRSLWWLALTAAFIGWGRGDGPDPEDRPAQKESGAFAADAVGGAEQEVATGRGR